LFVRIPLLGRIGPLASTFDFVADAAPGVKEILGVGKLCYEVRERNYDLVVVDAEASGHIVSQIGAPKVIADLVQVGLVRDQTQWMLDILNDPSRTGVAVVTTPEEMPVTETIELLTRLRAETGAHASAVIANRVLPVMFNRREQAIVDRLDEVLPLLIDAAGPGVPTVLEAARLTEIRRSTGAGHLDRLRDWLTERDEVPDGLPIITVPELFSRASGPRVVSLVADALTDELDPDSLVPTGRGRRG
jgi:anion-transporting  ArsA/GET3 family ATPase